MSIRIKNNKLMDIYCNKVINENYQEQEKYNVVTKTEKSDKEFNWNTNPVSLNEAIELMNKAVYGELPGVDSDFVRVEKIIK